MTPTRRHDVVPASSTVDEAATVPGRFYGWRIVRTLAVTETISWGVLYYAFAVLLVPMRVDLGLSTATLTGAFSLAVAVTGLAALPAGRWVDRHGARALMTVGSIAAGGPGARVVQGAHRHRPVRRLRRDGAGSAAVLTSRRSPSWSAGSTCTGRAHCSG